MGEPKALKLFRGKAMLDRMVGVMSQVAPVTLLGEGEITTAATDLPRLDDDSRFVGPLAGVASAFAQSGDFSEHSTLSKYSHWLIAACDQPLLGVQALRWLLDQSIPDAAAIVGETDGWVQPFPGLYQPGFQAILEAAPHDATISGLLAQPHVVRVPIPGSLTGFWSSANTPEELQRLERADEGARER